MSTHNRCFVNDEKKICFINIPKNASTTIRISLKLKHVQLTDKYKTYNKIVVIRDPMTRAVAIFNEVIKLRADGNNPAKTRSSGFYKLFKVKHDIPKSFGSFLDYIKNNLYDDHMVEQYRFLENNGLTIDDIEHVILFENLNEELENLIKLYDIDCPKIRRLTVGYYKIKLSLKNVLGKYRKKIQLVYSKDFELYNQVKKNYIQNK
jgi:hypothetical protein